MNNLKKIIFRNAACLRAGSQRMRDIYELVFDYGDQVMVELPTMTRTLSYTYRQVKTQIESFALRIHQAVHCTDRFIGLYADNSLEWIVTFWAILRSGNKPFLINLRLPRENVNSSLRTLDALCVISCKQTGEFAVPTFEYADLAQREVAQNATLGDTFADAFALSTSGTTLKEKICVYSGKVLSQQILNVESIVKVNPKIIGATHGQIKMLAFLPLYHIFGLEAMYLWFAFFGAAFVFLQDLQPDTILRTIRNHNVTHVFAVPLLWHAIEKGILRKLNAKDEKTQRKFQKAVKLSLKLQNLWPWLGAKVAKTLLPDFRWQLY